MKSLLHKKLFLVDDDKFIAEMFKQHITTLGFKDVTIFSDGSDALTAMIDNPEIIFLDYNMDTLNGFETLKKIKRFNPNIFVVMVSGQEDMSITIDSLKYGAFDYIIKGKGDLERITDVLNRIEIFKNGLAENRKTITKKISGLFFKSL